KRQYDTALGHDHSSAECWQLHGKRGQVEPGRVTAFLAARAPKTRRTRKKQLTAWLPSSTLRTSGHNILALRFASSREDAKRKAKAVVPEVSTPGGATGFVFQETFHGPDLDIFWIDDGGLSAGRLGPEQDRRPGRG